MAERNRGRVRLRLLLAAVGVLLLTAACQPIQPLEERPAAEGQAASVAVDYNLGEAMLLESHLATDSRFREMPVRLNGVIAVPQGEGPAPVALILHGTHPGCPETRHMVDEWPCAPDIEQRNYAGWSWLAQRLADAGYVVLAPNINAEYTFGWGEAPGGQRLLQLVDLHLGALAAASAGEASAPDFGVDVVGRADLGNLLLIGHSRGAGEAFRLLRERNLEDPPPPDGQLYGPARGFLAVAAMPTVLDDRAIDVPLVLVQPSCDGDVVAQDGQTIYESLRLTPNQHEWAVSLWLEGATHNAFNTNLGADMIGDDVGRPECETLLDTGAQRRWLGDVAADFATALSADAPAAAEARVRLGLDVTKPVPTERFGLPVRTISLSPNADRLSLFTPASPEELETNALGGAVSAQGAELLFCPAGFSTPFMLPGTEACRRREFTIPGNPQMLSLHWDAPDAFLALALPEGAGELSAWQTLSLRVAVDPLSPLNDGIEAQALTLRLTDGSGATAAVLVADEVALQVPVATLGESEGLPDGFFSAPVPLTTVRVPLSRFDGIDLSNVREVALLFGQRESGAIFLADIELVRAATE